MWGQILEQEILFLIGTIPSHALGRNMGLIFCFLVFLAGFKSSSLY